MSTAVVTILTRSYIPLARVLMDSVAEHFPESRRYVLLLDGEAEPISDAQVLRMSDILSAQEELIQSYIYSPYQLATALKPHLLMHVLQEADQAFFLDPDMRLFQPMTSALEALRRGTGTLFTPHRLTPPAEDNRDLYEWPMKMYGAYNAGFVGATDASLPFLQWWDSRLRRDCLKDAEAGYWLDQKILDLAPGYFDIDLLKDPAYNVGWWNLEERPVRREGETWYAGSTPLVLMHYSNLRPNHERGQLPYLVFSSKSHVADDPAALAHLQQLEDSYVADLRAAGFEELGASPFQFDTTPAGHHWTVDDRRRYRDLVLAAEARGATPPEPDDLLRAPRMERLKLAIAESGVETPRALVHDGRRLWHRARAAGASGRRR